MKITFKNGPEFEVHKNETLLSAIRRAGLVSISAPCNGRQHCKKCIVKILEGRVRDINADTGAPDFSPPLTVLACSTVCESDVLLELPSDDFFSEAINISDLSSVSGLSSGQQSITRDIIPRAAIALDIGTTTISACLLDLDSLYSSQNNSNQNELSLVFSAPNNQRIFGADVISRINAARQGKTQELFRIINNQIKEMLLGFIKQFNIQKIETLIIAANTTMLHLFINIDPSPMGEMPFKPVFIEEKKFKGADLSLPVDKVYLVPSISAFIGADIVSGLASINILDKSASGDIILFIDIGTNGEIALLHKGKLFCTAAAAGPALEGAEISCGMGSVKGAINKISLDNGNISFTTIGNTEALGICGSGLIDAMAIMLEENIIDETGAFTDNELNEFVIAPGISILNRDVRQFQLAKSAILSAIKILCKKTGIEATDIKKVYIAGGLGFHLDQKSAVRSGLLPKEFLNCIEVCGNTSLKGAVLALAPAASGDQGEGFRNQCREIVKASELVDLASDPDFMDAFAENIFFPEKSTTQP